jgi:hypothetical protein
MIYPSLPGGYDFGIVRLMGAGIGNCLYAYFHAVVLARKVNCRIITPTWSSVKIGPLLRRERSLRRYGTMFRAHPDEIHGFMKTARLVASWPGHKRIEIRVGQPACAAPRGLTIVGVPAHSFTFEGLHPHRDMIRNRLLEILASPPKETPKWGAGSYAAAHVRLGDFRAAQSDNLQRSFRDGERIPLVWYEHAIRRVRTIFPELPVHVFSDGHEHELADIMKIDGVSLRREPNDVADLLALAQARLLIGSNSTFSRWAAFLGDMPTIWPNTKLREKPTGEATPILYVTDDFEAITREAVTVP